MHIKVYKYDNYPKNPRLIPNPFQKKYLIVEDDCELPEFFKPGIIEFIIKMQLNFGDDISYDWDNPSDHNLLIDKNQIINFNYLENISKSFKEFIKTYFAKINSTTEKITNHMILPKHMYENFFMEFSYNYENMDCTEKFQITMSIPKSKWYMDPTITGLTYKFKINH